MLKIYDPFEPFLITQKWGVPNPMYREAGFDFDRHNGIDCRPSTTLKTFPIYCPLENSFVYKVKYSPKGGGHEIWLLTETPVEMFERKDCHALIVLFHNDKVLVPEGYKPKLGELIAVGDNSGFSTGPHSHLGLYRVLYNRSLTYIDDNDANRSFDPGLFRTKNSAVDQASLTTLIRSNWRYYQYILSK